MAKKKKSALPAVQRRVRSSLPSFELLLTPPAPSSLALSRTFATTSIPKKPQPVVDIPPEDESVPSDVVADSTNGEGGGAAGGGEGAVEGGAGGEGSKKPEEEEWEKEESYLQSLVEKMQDKVDKEVARGVKVSSSPFSVASENDRLLTRVLRCAWLRRPSTSRRGRPRASQSSRSPSRSGNELSSSSSTRRRSTVSFPFRPSHLAPSPLSRSLTSLSLFVSAAPSPPIVASDSEKLLLRLAITHGVLVKVGFGTERVEQCLKALTTGWELEDAMDWVNSIFSSALILPC